MAKSLSVKVNAPELLEKQLKRREKREEYGIIALASSTEPYLPIEEKTGLTRKLLGIILKYKFPVEVATKSKLVLRDLDLLKDISKNAILPEDLKRKLRQGVIIAFSTSTLNEKLAKILEPGAPSSKERLETMEIGKKEGFLAGMCYIPLLPFLSEMIKSAKDHGADFVLVGGLTLFGKGPVDCKALYYKFLEKHYPELVSKYRSLYRIFPFPSKKYQKELDERVKSLCEKYGIKNRII